MVGNDGNLTTALPSVALRLELVELYFDFIHDQFHTLFHRLSFTNAVAGDEAPPVILYGMLALSARSVLQPLSVAVN